MPVVARVVLVDDHETARVALRDLLTRTHGDCEVVGEAHSAATALARVRESRPDVVVLDVDLPDGDGVQCAREILALPAPPSCILLTSYPEERGMLAAALVGAAAYLQKWDAPEQLADAVRAVARGERLLRTVDVVGLLDRLAPSGEDEDLLGELTTQQRRVFELVGIGLSNEQIGEELGLATGTVRNYVSQVLEALGLQRRTEIARMAARMAERRARGRTRGDG